MQKQISSLQNKINNVKQNANYQYTLTYKDIQNIEYLIQQNKKLEDENISLKITEDCYINLRRLWNKLVLEILGKDYYNMGIDTYTTDELTCQDIIDSKIKNRLKLFKNK